MFFWKASVLLDALRRHRPRVATVIASLPSFRSRQFHGKLRDTFPLCENISIDYAVLEKARRVMGIAADDIGWNDVGSWNAVYELAPSDAAGNAARGETLALDSSGNFVDVHGRLVALLGVRNLLVVDTPDALLVADRHRAQDVSALVKMLEKAGRNDLL